MPFLLKRILLSAGIILALISAGLCGEANAFNRSTASWRIHETKNFDIYFHNKDDNMAISAGRIAEKSLVEISKDLDIKKISGRIPLILFDFSDTPFGFTNVLQNKMWISVAQPEAFDLSDRTWLESIIRHELTHYLMGTKLDGGLKLGTGRILGWGMFPMWFIEGVAQREESSWNAIKDSAVRTALLTKTFLNLRELQVFYFMNYHGRRLGYNIGNSIVNFIAEKYGNDSIPRIIESTGYSVNGFNRALKKVTGRTLGEIFKMWQDENIKRYRERVNGKKSVREYSQPWTSFQGLNISPEFNGSGDTIYFLSNRGNDLRRLALYRHDFKTGRNERIIDNLEENYFLDENRGFIMFCRKTRDTYDNYTSDVYRYDTKTGQVRRITRWKRVQCPVYDYNDDKIFGILHESGATNICKFDLDGNITEKLTGLKYNSAVYELNSPVAKNGAARAGGVLFMNYFQNGRFSIAYTTTDKKSKNYGKIIPVTFSREMIFKPRAFVEGDGSYTVWFIKEADGVLNLYSMNLKIDDCDFKVTGCLRRTDFQESVLDFDYNIKNGGMAIATQTAAGTEITLLDGSKKYAERPEIFADGTVENSCGTYPCNAASYEAAATAECAALSENSSADGTAGTGECKIYGYRNKTRLEYVIPMAGSQSSKILLGPQLRFADPINRHTLDMQLLGGSKKYRFMNATYMYRGFKPTIGFSAYDVVRDLRPGVLENVKGIDGFMNLKLFDASLTFDIFDRMISPDSISPRLKFRPGVADRENKDRGYFMKFVTYNAENSVDSDIHPLNALYMSIYHHNSSARFNSFYQYRINRIEISKWFTLSERMKNTLKLKAYAGRANGDYDFQIGGHNDLRGYSSKTLAGRKMQVYSAEYSHSGITEPLKLKVFSINRVYPALFFDIGSAYDDGGRKKWYRSAGLEFKTRLLIFKKTPLIGKTGIAKRLDDDKSTEVYSAFELKF